MFYVDFEASLASDVAGRAVAEMRRECPYLKVLGSYPARTTTAGAVDRLGNNGDVPVVESSSD